MLCFEGTNPCSRSNGGCQQLCFHLGSGRRTCSCAHGRLAEDGFACERYEGYLLYSERTILKSIHLSDENDLNSPVQPFENPAFFKNVITLAFDYSQETAGANRIFFSDVHFGNIQMINDDWTGRFIIAESKWIPYWQRFCYFMSSNKSSVGSCRSTTDVEECGFLQCGLAVFVTPRLCLVCFQSAVSCAWHLEACTLCTELHVCTLSNLSVLTCTCFGCLLGCKP